MSERQPKCGLKNEARRLLRYRVPLVLVILLNCALVARVPYLQLRAAKANHAGDQTVAATHQPQRTTTAQTTSTPTHPQQNQVAASERGGTGRAAQHRAIQHRAIQHRAIQHGDIKHGDASDQDASSATTPTGSVVGPDDARPRAADQPSQVVIRQGGADQTAHPLGHDSRPADGDPADVNQQPPLVVIIPPSQWDPTDVDPVNRPAAQANDSLTPQLDHHDGPPAAPSPHARITIDVGDLVAPGQGATAGPDLRSPQRRRVGLGASIANSVDWFRYVDRDHSARRDFDWGPDPNAIEPVTVEIPPAANQVADMPDASTAENHPVDDPAATGGHRPQTSTGEDTNQWTQVVFRNPMGNGGAVSFLVDHHVYTLRAGEAHELPCPDVCTVKFHRGESFGVAQQQLSPGVYEFGVDAGGWHLRPVRQP